MNLTIFLSVSCRFLDAIYLDMLVAYSNAPIRPTITGTEERDMTDNQQNDAEM